MASYKTSLAIFLFLETILFFCGYRFTLDSRKNKVNVLDQEGQNVEEEKEVVTDIDEKVNKSEALFEAGLVNNHKEEIAVNRHEFSYLINEPNKCKHEDGSDKDVFLLVLILSVHANFERRMVIRRTWGRRTNIDGLEVVAIFLLANRNDDKLHKLVLEEHKRFRDIIMEDFFDTYENLTLKTIMGMKWMSTFCAQAKFMMKTDDDMYVSYANILDYLNKSPKTNFVTCHVVHTRPVRDPKSKWYVSNATYPSSDYPPYCLGGGYILSGDLPPKIHTTSLSTPLLYIEDVYVGVCLDKLHIIPKHHPEFHNWKIAYTFCNFKKILTAHGVSPKDMFRYWKDQSKNKSEC